MLIAHRPRLLLSGFLNVLADKTTPSLRGTDKGSSCDRTRSRSLARTPLRLLIDEAVSEIPLGIDGVVPQPLA